MHRHRLGHRAHAPPTALVAFARIAAIALAAAAAATGAWPACKTTSDGAGASSDPPGSSFGAEITVTVTGRGRITSNEGSIDCPSKCFTRIFVDDPTKDGAPPGVLLTAESTSGAHFVGWKAAELPLGMRARGPSQCSPMTRMSSNDVIVPFSTVLSVKFGETNGTPPRGHEDECEPFRRVPVAYALTAAFAEDVVDAGRDAGPDAGAEVLFEPPPSAAGLSAKEIGIAGGALYWRIENGPLSGIVRGVGKGSTSVIVAPTESFSAFDVDAHVLYQTPSGLRIITGGSSFASSLDSAPTCVALASDDASAYCRAPVTLGTTIGTRLWRWDLSGSPAPTVVYSLPPGNDLAVDFQRLYFSSDQGGFTGQAFVQSAPRTGNVDGGAPFTTTLAIDQTSPRDLVVGNSYLFWLDARGGGVYSATSVSKFGGSNALVSTSGTTVRFVAADPVLNQYWVGVSGLGAGAASILRATPGSLSTTPFRIGLTGLGGIAVDNTFVYWTQTDGRVYRALKNDNGL